MTKIYIAFAGYQYCYNVLKIENTSYNCPRIIRIKSPTYAAQLLTHREEIPPPKSGNRVELLVNLDIM